MNKKILFITQFFPPDYAATGQLVYELLMGLNVKEMDIEVFTSKPSYAFNTNNSLVPSKQVSGGIKIRRSSSINIFSKRIRTKAVASILFFARSFVHILRHLHKKDLLVLTSAPPFLLWLGSIASLFFRCPYICIVYDLYPNILINLNIFSKNHWLMKLWNKVNYYTWKKSSQIVVLDSSMKQRIIETYPELEEKITIIHNWADENFIVPRPKNDNWFAKEYDLCDTFTVLYSGNMGHCHDMKTIIGAAHYLKSEKIKFLMIGHGAKRKLIEQKMEELDLDNIVILPPQDKDVLPYSLTAGDLSLISMDKNMDGLVSPSKLYSALASGLPIATICPQNSFLCSLISKLECGQSFKNGESKKLADFILLLSKDSQLSKNMGKASRNAFNSNFKRNIAIQKYYSVFKNVVMQSKSVVYGNYQKYPVKNQ